MSWRGIDRRLSIVTVLFAPWLVIIDVLRAQRLPSMIDHADLIEAKLELHAVDAAMVTIGLTEEVYLFSINWARGVRTAQHLGHSRPRWLAATGWAWPRSACRLSPVRRR
jgi:hypothetical protein